MSGMATIALPESAADALRADESALLLWDLQNGLAGQAPGLPELSPVWRELRDAARASGVLVVRSRHVAPRPDLMDPVTRWRIGRRMHGENRPEHYMQPGGEDTAWIPGFEPGPDELVVEKSVPTLFHATDADARLRARGVRTLVIAGVATEQGVHFTARHAMAFGYFVVIAEDAVGSYSPEAHDLGMALLRRAAFVATSDEIAAAWQQSARRPVIGHASTPPDRSR